MVDNRPDTRVSMRTPLARVKGLGAAGHGVETWWLDRLQSGALVPLVIALVIILASLAGRTYAEALAVVAHPVVAILLILLVIVGANHMRLGMQVVIEDYVHDKGWKIAALAANNFFVVVVAVVCLFSILKISFGWAR